MRPAYDSSPTRRHPWGVAPGLGQSNANLEYDHIVPLAMGGSNTERNLQLLCADCNREKGASL